MLEEYTFMPKIIFTQNFIHALWFKWFQAIYIFFVFQNLSMCHTYIYSIGPTSKSIEYHLFEQFSKFLELPMQFLPDMSGLWPGHIRLAGHARLQSRTCLNLGFPSYIRELSAPLRTLDLFFSSTPSLAVAKGSLGDFGSSPPNPIGFLEIWLPFSSGTPNPKWFSLS
jgi:hypothetical protein